MPAPSSLSAPPASAELLDRTRHHIALRLLPFLFVLYIANYLDRTNIAYAAIGISRDLGFSDRVFGLGAGIFFVSYVALQVPGALLVERWSARRMICATMVTWGLLTVLTALVHTPAQLYLARFLLGAAEAGFFPGVIVYLSHWFISSDRAKATSNFMAAIPVSLIIGSPLAGWILGHSWRGTQGWRWLFFLEGAPAVLLGIVAFFYLTDWPQQAGWLRPEQRHAIQAQLERERAFKLQASSIAEALRSRTVVLLATVTFLNYFAFYTFIFWLPTLLKRQWALTDMRVGLLAAIPYMAFFIAMQVNGWHSDKTGERRWHAAVPSLVAAAGFLGLIVHPGDLRLSLVFFTMASVGNAYLSAGWAIPTEVLGRSAAAAAVGAINAIASTAGFAGPILFAHLSARTGSFTAGLFTMMLAALGAGVLVLCLPRRPPMPEH